MRATLDRQGGRIEAIERALHKNGDMDDQIREGVVIDIETARF